MIKFLLGLAIVSFTSFCGYLLTKKYRQRKLFFTQLREFNERFIGEISYFKRPLADFFSRYTYKGEFSLLLKDFFEYMKKDGNYMEEVLNFSEYSFLKKQEKSAIIDYFSMLGKGDSASQKAYFTSAKEMVIKLQTQSEADCKKYGDLYLKMGFLLGLFILILII